jgi:hypothetical protein
MSQALSRRPPTEEDRFDSRLCGICGEQSGIGRCLALNTAVLPVSIIPPMLHTHSHKCDTNDNTHLEILMRFRISKMLINADNSNDLFTYNKKLIFLS